LFAEATTSMATPWILLAHVLLKVNKHFSGQGQTETHTVIHTYIHTQAERHTQSYIHTYIHTHIHTD